MGMAASQARFLGLTARKSNVEYEGQQINQQRTTLSNQSAAYYTELLGMSVPTVPSVDDYTSTVYTFEDGALSNTVTALIASTDGTYSLSYLRSYTDDFAIVSSTSSIVTQTTDGTTGDVTGYRIGSNTLRSLGVVETEERVGSAITSNGVSYSVLQDDAGYYIDEIVGEKLDYQTCTEEEIANIQYYYYDSSYPDEITQYYKDADDSFYCYDTDGNKVTNSTIDQDDMIMALIDSSQTEAQYAVSYVEQNTVTGDYEKEVYVDDTQKTYLSDEQIDSIKYNVYVSDDEYLSGLTSDELAALKTEEESYLAMLREEFGEDTDWLVKYVEDSSTGAQVPYFYQLDTLENAQYNENGHSQSNISCYTVGSATVNEEIKAVSGCVLEQDSSGRYINISIPVYDSSGTATGTYTTYALTTTTATDQ
ncbi:MAG: hypothetical protein R3Y28_07600, partial [Candidatus Gastranaerophilales bacterium]